jgi:hypothetical protein
MVWTGDEFRAGEGGHRHGGVQIRHDFQHHGMAMAVAVVENTADGTRHCYRSTGPDVVGGFGSTQPEHDIMEDSGKTEALVPRSGLLWHARNLHLFRAQPRSRHCEMVMGSSRLNDQR